MKLAYLSKLLRVVTTIFCIVVAIYSCKKDKQATTCKHTPLVLSDSACNMNNTRYMHENVHEIFSSGGADTSYTIDSVAVAFVAQNNTTI